MKKLLLMTVLVSLLVLAFPFPAHAQGMRQAASMDWLDMILKLALGFGALVGVAALVAAIINVLKVAGVVKDETAGQWSAVLNLIGFAILAYFAVFQPQVATEVLDGYAGQIATVLLFITGYLVQIFVSPAVHAQLKAMRIPLLGASNS